jgi:ribonuclease-3
MPSLDLLLKHLNYNFTQPAFLHEALTHSSAGTPNNERMEFLGDALLGFVIATALYHQYNTANEGQLSRLRSRLVNRETLTLLAKDIDLGEYLHLGIGELNSGGKNKNSTLSNAMEAILAAVYLDGGLDAATRLILHLYKERLYEKLPEQNIKDSKTKLQELMQARANPLPEYEVIEISGSQHQQWFKVCCRISNYSNTTEGSGSTKRSAEQQAAQKMLAIIVQE